MTRCGKNVKSFRDAAWAGNLNSSNLGYRDEQ